MVNNQNDPLYSRQVIEFITVANEFCIFSEKINDYTRDDIITYYLRIIPLLYLKGSLIKDITPENPDNNERFVLEEDWENLLNAVRNKLYPDDNFWIAADPHDVDTEAEKSSISECIADIYQDMKDFIMLYQKNTRSAKENAVHEVFINYPGHWGPALTKALYALHLLYADTL